MKNVPIWLIVLALASLALVAGCQVESAEETGPESPTATAEVSALSSPLNSPVATPEPIEASTFASPVGPTPTPPNPDEGLAAIQGTIIINDRQGTPLRETVMYLMPGFGENGDQLPPLLVGGQDDQIFGITDMDGHYSFNNVPPGNYFIIIWAPLSWVVLHQVEGEQQLVILIHLEPNEVLDLGTTQVQWP